MMRTKTVLTIIGATAALGAGGAVASDAAAFGAATSSASSSPVAGGATSHIEGRIVAVSPASVFTVRDRMRGPVTLNVTMRTRFDRIAGFSALRAGERVDVRALRSNGRFVATNVEPHGIQNLSSLHESGRAGIRNAAAGGDDPAGHDVGDDRGDEVAGHDRGDDHGGQRGPDDGAGHDRGDDHGGSHGRH